jgi:hypothetical protein
LKICIVYGIRREIIQLEIDVSLLIGIQERETREIRKKMTRKKEKIVLKTRDFSNQKEQSRSSF